MTPSITGPASASYPTLSRRQLALSCLTAVFTYIFLANAWLGDDAYITFRVIWNFLNGYGVTFNPGERVQAYTHPLWMLVLMSAHALTREFFFTALIVSYGFSLATLVVVLRTTRELAASVVAFLWLVSSKAFVDYTASGLENPLSYLLLALFYARLFKVSHAALTPRELRRFGVLAGLAFVNRIDTFLLYALPLTWLVIRGVRRRDERTLQLLVAAAIPVGVWFVFATLYYGFPLPNTYYAKVATGIPAALTYRQGFAYLLNSFSFDPITLGTIGIAAAMAIRSPLPIRLAAASSLAYVAYTVTVGGDFMSGRFFAAPFLVSVLALLHAAQNLDPQWPLAAGLVLYNIVIPLAPIKTTAAYDAAWPWRSQNGIKDERGHYHRITNVFLYSPFRELPDHTWVREGRSFRESSRKSTVQGSIGFYGLMAGPDKHIIDRNALSDPLLARLPVSPELYFEFYVGHYFRDLPEGYVESIEHGDNRLADPMLRAYYDRLTSVVRGPIFSASRFRNLWYLNIGSGRRFADRYAERRSLALSIAASNERFETDVGVRDARSGAIRSTNRAGFLQYGPGIPLKSGNYRARWIGTVRGGRSGSLGFADVQVGERRVARREIAVADISPDSQLIAELAFSLEEDVDSVEYRLWVTGEDEVVLNRIELISTLPPPSPDNGQ